VIASGVSAIAVRRLDMIGGMVRSLFHAAKIEQAAMNKAVAFRQKEATP
jgi:hypothetical protein